MADGPATGALEALTHYFVGDASMEQTMERVCAAVLASIEPAVLAGMTMTVDARVDTYVSTHPDVVEIDRGQYQAGQGPCLDSFRTGEPVLIRSTVQPGPYPEFRATAARFGIRSVASLPMRTNEERVGALNLYSEIEDGFTDEHIRLGGHFADHAAFVLVNTKAYWDARVLSEDLAQAMESRAVIEQAKGVIMAASGCTADDAFEQLTRQAQQHNASVRDTAHEVVQRARRARHS